MVFKVLGLYCVYRRANYCPEGVCSVCVGVEEVDCHVTRPQH